MLILENVTVHAAAKLFTPSQSKELRINLDQQSILIRGGSRFVSSTSLDWVDPIVLPLSYSKPFQFQITNKHKFGFNPQELNGVLHGQITVQPHRDSWAIYDSNNLRVGEISANVRSKSVVTSKIAPSVEEMFITESIIVSMREKQFKRAYLIIKIGANSMKTNIVKSKGGEAMFVEGYEMPTLDEFPQATFEIYSYDARDHSSKLIGSAVIDLEDPKHKIAIKDSNGVECGEAFVDWKKATRDQYLSHKLLSQIVQKSMHSSQDALSQSLLGGRSAINQSKMHESKMHESKYSVRPSPKKTSVVYSNNCIKIPQEERFKIYQDKRSDRISYLQERSFQFREQHSNRFYRGASIGKGSKGGVLLRSNPGVGEYHLPSIWDRY